ncbi:MAG: hypothetical protein DRJ07_13280 [Bacteroidetes bacterium]|nr:MAG: hypothetical protein DRJ07_13280 [Bacteroidota bacterium]
MFYTFTCPNCKTFKKMLEEELPQFKEKFEFKKTLANSPLGFIRTAKLGIHSVPTVLIDTKIIWREVPTKQELNNKLKSY